MKNYELIAKLMEQPAGMEVQFSSIVEKKNVEENDNDSYVVTASINDVDVTGYIINLYG